MTIKKVDPIEFQKKFKTVLESKLKKLKKTLNEETDSAEFFRDDDESEDEVDSMDELNPDELDSDAENDIEEKDDPADIILKDVSNQTTDEHKVVVEIQDKANEFGADVMSYRHGVMEIQFNDRDESEKFMDWIEDYDSIDSYEFKSCEADGTELDSETEDCSFYRFWVYLNPDVVSYDYFDELNPEDEDEMDDESESDDSDDEKDSDDVTDEDSEEKSKEDEKEEDSEKVDETDEELEDEDKTSDKETDESKEEDDEDSEEKPKKDLKESLERKVKVNFKGQKRIKMSCGPGYKYNHETKSCEKITGQELTNLRKRVRKSLITKAQEGVALKKRTAVRTKRADKFRTSYGLD